MEIMKSNSDVPFIDYVNCTVYIISAYPSTMLQGRCPYFHFYRLETKAQECYFSKVLVQIISCEAKIRTQVSLTPKPKQALSFRSVEDASEVASQAERMT